MRIPGYTPGPVSRADAKDTLRRAVRARRVDLGDEHRARAAQAVARHLPHHPLVARLAPGAVLVPSTHRDELDTQPTAVALARLGWQIHRPRATAEPPRIDAVPWPPDDPLRPGYMGIPEPPASAAAVDPHALRLILVPGIAFDRHGHRIGTGAGYFDRFLAPLVASARPPVVIGVGFDVQLVDGALPYEEHDVPLHGLQLEERALVARALRDDVAQ